MARWPTAEEDASALSALAAHNASGAAHADIREQLESVESDQVTGLPSKEKRVAEIVHARDFGTLSATVDSRGVVQQALDYAATLVNPALVKIERLGDLLIDSSTVGGATGTALVVPP